jgi:hypothetical protein
VSAVLDFDRGSHDGLLWAGGKRLVLAHWSPLLRAVGVRPEAGRGEVQLWTQLRDQRVQQVTLHADIDGREAALRAPVRAATAACCRRAW